jgi:hypothetical protein
MTSRPSTAAPILAVLIVLAALLGLYVGGYFWLGRESRFYAGVGSHRVTRLYRYEWASSMFAPAAYLESWLRGVHTRASHNEESASPSL